MRLLDEATSPEPDFGDGVNGTGAVLGLAAAFVSFLAITTILVLCAGSPAASKSQQTQEAESRQTSNMIQGTSVRSWTDKTSQEVPAPSDGPELASDMKQNSAPTDVSIGTEELPVATQPAKAMPSLLASHGDLTAQSTGMFSNTRENSESTAATTSGQQHSGKCDIELEGDNVSDVMKLLHRICDEMGGMVGPSHVLHRHTIREGLNTAVAEVTSLGVTSTAMFFPDKRRYNRQMKMYKKQWVCDFMPNVNMCSNGAEFRNEGKSVMLPSHIMVDRCTSISEALSQCPDEKAVSVEVFLVCIQLYYQISAFHIRKKVIRDLCTKNVVQTLTGTQRRWTMLEYCSTVAAGTESTHVALSMTTPELAAPRMMNEPLRIERPFDVWQLGILVYETVQGQQYWRPGLGEAAILHSLASKDMQLPHESNPLRLDNVQTMLGLLLARSPDERPRHDGLKEVLEDHDKSGTVGVWSNHPSHPNAHAVGTVDLPT